MKKIIRIEQTLDRQNASLDSYVSVVNGSIEKAAGLCGITQFEDLAVFPIKDKQRFLLPLFLWMHYFSIVLEISGDSDCYLEFFDGHGAKKKIDLQDIGFTPALVNVSNLTYFSVLEHNPKAETGNLSVFPNKVVAGEREVFAITYTAAKAVGKGGKIRVLTPYSNWGEPRLDSFRDINIKSDSKDISVDITLTPYPMAIRGYVYEITIISGVLNPGESITFYYKGNYEGIRSQPYVQEKMYFLCWEDSDALGNFIPLALAQTSFISVIAGKPAKMRIKTQQIIGVKDNIKAKLLILDNMLNAADYNGMGNACILNSNDEEISSCQFLVLNGSAYVYFTGLESGLYYIRVCVPGLRDELISISVTDDKSQKIYYGEIHGHSQVSDGTFSQDAYFDYGKNIGLLDFCALSDHDWEIIEHPRNKSNNRLEALNNLVEDYYTENEYVTICGFEWMGEGGHMNAYFLDGKKAEVYSGNIKLLQIEEIYPTQEGFLKNYEGRDDVLVFPHFSHGFDYLYHVESLQPLAEIYSQWGFSSEEKAVNKIKSGAIEHLDSGKRFGFIAGADTHHGMPGQTGYWSKYNIIGNREGLMAVYSPKLTRPELFSAFKNRAVYATSGERILIEFFVGGVLSGGELNLSDLQENIDISYKVGGTNPIESVEIISGGGACIYRISQLGILKTDNISLRRNKTEHEYYYLKVKQENGEYAWSSPVFINKV